MRPAAGEQLSVHRPAGDWKTHLRVEAWPKVCLCERHADTELAPCQQCPACQQIARGLAPRRRCRLATRRQIVHPDRAVHWGSRASIVAKACVIASHFAPAAAGDGVAIIDDADWMNQEGANSLAQDAGRASTSFPVDLDRHQSATSVAHHPVALPNRSVPAVAARVCRTVRCWRRTCARTRRGTTDGRLVRRESWTAPANSLTPRC